MGQEVLNAVKRDEEQRGKSWVNLQAIITLARP